MADGLATSSPDSQTKSCQMEPDEKIAGSVWLPGPKVCRKLEGSWPDCTRQDSVRILLRLQKETESGVVWLNLASFLQFSFQFLVQETR